MRTLIIFSRAVRIGLQSFFRHAWLTLAAMMVMVVALSMIMATIVLHIGAQNAIKELSQNLELPIYLVDGVEPADTVALQEAIIANPAVVGIDFIDPLEARDNFFEAFGEDEQLLRAFELADDDEVLSSSIRVSLDDVDQIGVIAELAAGPDYEAIVERVPLERGSVAQIAIERARSVRGFVVTASSSLAVVLASVSCLIIFNTIRIAIFSRRSEIEIMRLVGARPEFIRGSFLVEASLAGLVAGLAAVGIVYVGLGLFGDWALSQPELRPTHEMFYQATTIWRMVAGSVLGGIAVGLLSSYWATRRYLRLTN